MDNKIAVDELLPFEWLEPAISGFLKEYPTTSLKFSSEVLNGTWDSLIENRADIIIAASKQPDLELPIDYLELASISYVFVVAPSHPLASHSEPLTSTLIQHYRLVYISDTSQQLAKATSGYPNTHAYLSVPTIIAKLYIQLYGLGIGFLPKHLALSFIHLGSLVEKQVTQPKSPSRLVVACLANNSSQKIAALKKLIKDLDLGNKFKGLER